MKNCGLTARSRLPHLTPRLGNHGVRTNGTVNTKCTANCLFSHYLGPVVHVLHGNVCPSHISSTQVAKEDCCYCASSSEAFEHLSCASRRVGCQQRGGGERGGSEEERWMLDACMPSIFILLSDDVSAVCKSSYHFERNTGYISRRNPPHTKKKNLRVWYESLKDIF